MKNNTQTVINNLYRQYIYSKYLCTSPLNSRTVAAESEVSCKTHH